MSQRGFFLMMCDKGMLDDHNNLHQCHVVAWSSGRIHRVVRSTLSAEAYSCSEALDALFWLRAVVAEVTDDNFVAHDYVEAAQRVPAALVTDCRSLWDCITKERVQLSDRRLSLEAAIIRQEAEHCDMKWVRSEQQVADCLTKDLELSYAALVFTSNLWTLGPDKRAPTTRNRKLEDPSRHARVTADDDIPMMNVEAMKAIKYKEQDVEDTAMDTLLATTMGVMPWRPQGLSRQAIAIAVIAGQVYKSSANAVVPLASAGQHHNVQATVMVMVIIFMMGICVGCGVQWIVQRTCRADVQIGRPLLEYRPPTPSPTPASAIPTMPQAAAKAVARPRAKAKTESVAKAKAQPIAAKAKAQPADTVERVECPLCNEHMVFKRAMRGGYFWGCSDYPICRGSRRP